MNAGKIIVIEGADGSGKTTQYELLCNKLKNEQVPILKHKFPSYGTKQASLVEMYLSGIFGKDADSVDYKRATSFYAVDRCAEFMLGLQKKYDEGKILMLDRYTTSNMVHQACKLKTEREILEAIKWIAKFEFEDLKLPIPDLVYYLSISDKISEKLIANRLYNAGIEKDIHESDVEYLKKARNCGLICANYFNWEVINCDNGEKLRSIEDIHQEVYTLMKKRIKN